MQLHVGRMIGVLGRSKAACVAKGLPKDCKGSGSGSDPAGAYLGVTASAVLLLRLMESTQCNSVAE